MELNQQETQSSAASVSGVLSGAFKQGGMAASTLPGSAAF